MNASQSLSGLQDLRKTKYITYSSTRPSWTGWGHVENLVVFGDSYSTTSFQDQSVWVDHIADQQQPIRIQNYARPGDMASEDLDPQLERFFAENPKTPTPEAKPTLDSTTTLYALWIGINDCGTPSIAQLANIVKKVFDVIESLYTNAGARHFLLIDMPPLGRCPAGAFMAQDLGPRYIDWNTNLRQELEAFVARREDVTAFLFASHELLNDILDDPEEYGFTESDTREAGWGIWSDVLHLTTAAHSIIADGIVAALS